MLKTQDVLRVLGKVKKTGAGEWIGSCPVHGHRDNFSVTDDGGKALVHCFAGCQQDAVVAKLKSLIGPVARPAAVAALPEPMAEPAEPAGEKKFDAARGLELVERHERLLQESAGEPSSEIARFLSERGISAQVAEKLRLGFRHEARPAIVIPAFWNGELVGLKYRALDGEKPKWWQEPGSRTDFIQYADLLEGVVEHVIVTEGPLDAAMLLSQGFAAVGVASAGAVPKSGDPTPRFQESIDVLKRHARRIVCLGDQTPDGVRAMIELQMLIGQGACSALLYPFFDPQPGIRDGAKDVTEAFQMDGPQYLRLRMNLVLSFWADKEHPVPQHETEGERDGRLRKEASERRKVFLTAGRHDLVFGRPLEKTFTDYGNAQRFAFAWGDVVRYCPERGAWLVWNGKRWKEDSGVVAERLAKRTVIGMLDEAAKLGQPKLDPNNILETIREITDGIFPGEGTEAETDKLRAALIRHEQTSESGPRLREILRQAQSEPGIPIAMRELDRDKMLFNCRNGVIDLRTGKLREHKKEDLLSKIAPIAFDTGAGCPKWSAFLDTVTAGDQDLARYLRRIAGYCLTGDVGEQCFFILWGSGKNGKTTFVETLRRMLGDYARDTPMSTFMATKGDRIPSDVARLQGARFVTAAESEDDQRLAEALVKKMSGSDRQTVRFMYKDYFEFDPQFKLVLATNRRPKIRGTDEAIWRRVRLIPFTAQIPEGRRIKNYHEVLAAEAPGILNWALAGLAEWRERGLGEPVAVEEATKEYREDMDVFGDFIADRCVAGEGLTATAKGLYLSYKEWAEANGHEPMSAKTFSIRLADRGFKKDREKTGERLVFWKGIALSKPASAVADEDSPF